jgi:hypothetical protein
MLTTTFLSEPEFVGLQHYSISCMLLSEPEFERIIESASLSRGTWHDAGMWAWSEALLLVLFSQLLNSKGFPKIESLCTRSMLPQVKQAIPGFLGTGKLSGFDPPKGQVLRLHALEPFDTFHKYL